jgi:hypothetical protein
MLRTVPESYGFPINWHLHDCIALSGLIQVPDRSRCHPHTQAYPTRTLGTLACLPSYNTWISWHSRSSPESQMSSSESSLLEEQMQEKHQSCREWSTPRRVQRSTGLINRETRHLYVLLPAALSISSSCQVKKLDPSAEVGGLFSPVTTDRDDAACSVACMTSRTNSYSRSMTVMFSTTPVDLNLEVAKN